jgi:O-antigen biosynthesis protein
MEGSLRETLKRNLPNFVRDRISRTRGMLSPPMENSALHDYDVVRDDSSVPRLTLIIPTISPEKTFGGVTTGIDLFLEIGKKAGAQFRVLLDDYGTSADPGIIAERARRLGIDSHAIEVIPRTAAVPQLPVRKNEVFFAYNCWNALNIRVLCRKQCDLFGVTPRPYLHFIQDYDPEFYPFSSTHMMAKLSYENRWPSIVIFNTGELHEYFRARGHSAQWEFVLEPRLSNALRPFLEGTPPVKTKTLLVYGRESIPRNCFPAVTKGLKLWAARYPEYGEWQIVSAGQFHSPITIAPGRVMASVGKLSLERYGELLRSTAVGLSLMSSPHPSYPPLEMTHFGVRTVSNNYANKNLALSHENFVPINDIAPETIADALAKACRAFEEDPLAGWTARSLRPSYLQTGPYKFIDEVVTTLKGEVWH